MAGAAVGGAAYYAGKKGQESANREADQEALVEDQASTPAPAAPAAEESYVDELEQLAKLHEEGILTDEEFDAKKKEILGL